MLTAYRHDSRPPLPHSDEFLHDRCSWSLCLVVVIRVQASALTETLRNPTPHTVVRKKRVGALSCASWMLQLPLSPQHSLWMHGNVHHHSKPMIATPRVVHLFALAAVQQVGNSLGHAHRLKPAHRSSVHTRSSLPDRPSSATPAWRVDPYPPLVPNRPSTPRAPQVADGRLGPVLKRLALDTPATSRAAPPHAPTGSNGASQRGSRG